MSRRKKFHDFYAGNQTRSITGYDIDQPPLSSARGLLNSHRTTDSIRSSAASDKYRFNGARIANAVVVRADLNKYSKWALDKPIAKRAELLSEFFSKVVRELDTSGGIYFRDEGDCVVGLFSNYFSPSFSYRQAEPFCKAVVGSTYGTDKLTAKCCVAMGEIAIYQKAHEVGTDDWSAEGQPFVNAARLELSVPSKPAVFYFENEFKQTILPTLNFVGAGNRYYWLHDTENIQVPGLGLNGGWAEIHVVEHFPEGRT